LALIEDVRAAVSDREVSPDELAALVTKLTRAAIERGFSEFAEYTAYVHGMIGGVDFRLSKIGEHIESAWRMLGQCKEFSHIDPAGNVAEILEQREREQWEAIDRRERHHRVHRARLKVRETKRYGIDVWEVSGDTDTYSQELSETGGTWHAEDRIWTFARNPTQEIGRRLLLLDSVLKEMETNRDMVDTALDIWLSCATEEEKEKGPTRGQIARTIIASRDKG